MSDLCSARDMRCQRRMKNVAHARTNLISWVLGRLSLDDPRPARLAAFLVFLRVKRVNYRRIPVIKNLCGLISIGSDALESKRAHLGPRCIGLASLEPLLTLYLATLVQNLLQSARYESESIMEHQANGYHTENYIAYAHSSIDKFPIRRQISVL